MLSKKIKPSLRRLDSRGLAHYVLPLAIVLLVGVVGTYLLVASHADSLKPPKIRSATYTVSAGKGAYVKDMGWCATETFKFKVKTTGTVDHVDIRFEASAGSGPVATLTHVGGGVWTGSDGGLKVCASKQGGKADAISPFVTYRAYATSDAVHGGKSVNKALPHKKVTIRR